MKRSLALLLLQLMQADRQEGRQGIAIHYHVSHSHGLTQNLYCHLTQITITATTITTITITFIIIIFIIIIIISISILIILTYITPNRTQSLFTSHNTALYYTTPQHHTTPQQNFSLYFRFIYAYTFSPNQFLDLRYNGSADVIQKLKFTYVRYGIFTFSILHFFVDLSDDNIIAHLPRYSASLLISQCSTFRNSGDLS